MKAEMIRQVDISQVRPHQLKFTIRRGQEYFVRYLFSISVGALACLRDSKIFPAHLIPWALVRLAFNV
jgi:hypothetical protein